MEFKVNVRKLGLTEAIASSSEVDALYESLDEDGSGSLDINEMKTALKQMKEAERDVKGRFARKAAYVERLRQAAAKFGEAVAVTQVSEAEQERLQMMRGGTTASRLGELLKFRNVKVADVVNSWDEDRSGALDMDEFRQHVTALNFRATGEELDALFRQIDVKQKGALEIDEVLQAFKTLQEAASTAKKDEKAQRRVTEDSRRAAATAQQAAAEELESVMAEHHEAEAAAQAALTAKAEAVARAKAEKAAKEAAEKRAIREKSQARAVSKFVTTLQSKVEERHNAALAGSE